ncbi:recombinase family protein [Anaerotruncus sp. AF02-27]|uniref:recombinase family protein n=1 Tax=Anaerotruncus sp. AF02-27 TaxID=2292191 RepID=UPI000E4DA1A9|nr:recombinase family protein [Anaerotruncus sp. AF02-27]RGX56777.1 recombinase family protein [Anaerotruncus sp. AF02-27]
MSKYGYTRVSTRDQHCERQLEAIKAYCPELTDECIFKDNASGKNFERPAYNQLKKVLHPGDELIIKELDRLGRNKEGIKRELQWFKENHIIVRILNIPTTLIKFEPGQEWLMDMVNNILIEVWGSVAEQERRTTMQRQAEGIAVAKAEGRYTGENHKGRARNQYNKDRFDLLCRNLICGKVTQRKAAAEIGLSPATFSRRFNEWKKENKEM